MKALILNGAAALRDLADAVDGALSSRLAALGYEVARYDLAALDPPPCNGDLGCWLVTPGVCVQAGPHRDVARDLIQSDLAVWLTPVTFGGYSSPLKRQLDHCLPLLAPWFAKVDGETHHPPRYRRRPSLLAVGLLERPDPAAAAVFRRLVERSVLNMQSPRFASACLAREELPRLPDLVGRWLGALAASERPRTADEPPLDLAASPGLPPTPPRRALLLVGSPRPRSVSGAIAAHLGALLRERGVEVASERIHDCLRQDPALGQLAAAIGEADLIALATPLYVDSLPGPVTRALEILRQRREPRDSPPPRLLAIVNSGFPEAANNDPALAICRLFAAEAGLDWIGGLAVGGGGMLGGKPLLEQGGRARNVVRALGRAAEAIARGLPVPGEADRLARTPSSPAWLYRLIANRALRRAGTKRGTLSRFGERPYGP